MSSTRHADPDSPPSHEKYMSSPEFSGLQGINGTAVAKRCALLVSPAKRQFVWWLQGMTLADGGVPAFVKGFLGRFSKRITSAGPWTLYRRYSEDEVISAEEVRKFALQRRSPQPVGLGVSEHGAPTLEEFLIDLCINPLVYFDLPGDKSTAEFVRDAEAERAQDEYPSLSKGDFKEARLPYFRDIIGALAEYKREYEDQVRQHFCQTAISRQIWKQLDEALESRTMVTIEGLEGRGKTEAVQAWCKRHLGVARFVSLKGTNTKTAHFRELARALGVGHGISHKVSQMQASVEDLARTSKLMLVIDEAHFFFNQAPRMKTRPEMLDWIDTALCNPPTSLALVTTPQFMICMERAASQVGWNFRQFARRCKRYCRLPAKNSPEDVEAVAKHLLPGADRQTLKQVVAYEALSKRDLSAVGDVVREAKLLASQANSDRVSAEHVRRAIHEVLLVSDLPWAEMERRLRQSRTGRKALVPAEVSIALHGDPEHASVRGPVGELTQSLRGASRSRNLNPGEGLEVPVRETALTVA